MGKASKWIKNLLLGKREDKAKETGPSFPPETCTSTSLGIMAATMPKVRRRWSFKKTPSSRPITHKSSKSFDSIYMLKQAFVEYKAPPVLTAYAVATRIQAVYRSYLVHEYALNSVILLPRPDLSLSLSVRTRVFKVEAGVDHIVNRSRALSRKAGDHHPWMGIMINKMSTLGLASCIVQTNTLTMETVIPLLVQWLLFPNI